MATTKIWPIRDNLKRVVNYAGNPEKTEWNDLKQTLHYAKKEVKTTVDNEESCFVTGINCFAFTAFEEMMTQKQRFGKTGGNVAYHGYQSFKPDEVTPEQCHEIGIELAKRLWSDKYQILVATHLDKGHLHNHFVINSVSFIDGIKFNCDKRVYYEMRRESDELCRQHDLSVIENPKGKTPRSIYFAEKNGEPTKYNLMREAIDKAVGISMTMKQFVTVMKKQGYVLELSPNRKYPTIRSVNSKKPVRMYHLGDEYLPQAISQRILRNPLSSGKYHKFMNPKQDKYTKSRKVTFKGQFSKMKKITGFKALYFHYCYLLGIFPKGKHEKWHNPLSPEIKESLRKMERYSQEVRLVCRHSLSNVDDVNSFIEQTDKKILFVTAQRNSIYNKLRRCADPEQTMEYKKQRDICSQQLKALRKEKRIAGNILADVEDIKEKIRIERQMQVAYLSPDKIKQKRGYER